MRRQSKYLYLLSLGCVACLAAPSAHAQVTGPRDVLSVQERTIPENYTRGTPFRGFILVPALELQTTYDDNIFTNTTDKTSDQITEYNPALAILSNWNRHSVYVGLAGNFGRYRDNTAENFDNYGALISGTYDIAYETSLSASVARKWRDEGRGSIIQDNNRKLGYTEDSAAISFERDVSYIQLFLEGKTSRTELSKDSDPALADPDDYNARLDKEAEVTIAYEYMPNNQFYFTTLYSQSNYDLFGTGTRDSDGYDFRTGWKFNNDGTVNGGFFIAYQTRDFEDGSKDIDQPHWGANINWNISRLTTLSALIEKTFQPTTGADAAGLFRTARGLSLRHLLTDRLSIRAFTGLDRYEFVGGTEAFKRETNVFYAGLAGEYELRDGLFLKLGLDHQFREAGALLNEFEDNKATISLVYIH